MVATFDYKGFAKDLTKQAEDSMPEDIASEHKKEFLERIYDFTYIAGEAFSNDENITNSETAKILTQIISEWTFHKYVDLLRSGIPSLYHESILQKLGYVAFEMTREAALGNLSRDEMLKLVEVQLNKAYEKACSHLLKNGHISQEIYNKALNLSNIDTMSSRLYHNVKIKSNKFSTFKFTLSALLMAVIALGVNIFFYDYAHLDIFNTAALVVLSMYIGFYIGVKSFRK